MHDSLRNKSEFTSTILGIEVLVLVPDASELVDVLLLDLLDIFLTRVGQLFNMDWAAD